MIEIKIGPYVQLALRYERLFTEEYRSVVIDEQTGLWRIIIQYRGSLNVITEKYGVTGTDLGVGYAQINIEKDRIAELSNDPLISYISLPIDYRYIANNLGGPAIGNMTVCMNTIYATDVANPRSVYYSTGRGVLIAVIDSGINYLHPDFINEDGTTRIECIWDQTSSRGTPPTGYSYGTEYTREQINDALSRPTLQEKMETVAAHDDYGHGTAVAGIAAGNGRGSRNNVNHGIATEADLIVVKVGSSYEYAPTDLDIMSAVNYSMTIAETLRRPIVILIGEGRNVSSHAGNNELIEYLDKRCKNWISNIVVGMGNEGDKGAHVSGIVRQNETTRQQILVEGELRAYAFCICTSFVDDIFLTIEAPNGERTEKLSNLTPNRAFVFDNTAVMVNFANSSTTDGTKIIIVMFQAQGDGFINTGVWNIRLEGDFILQGNYDIWGQIISNTGNRTRFMTADLNKTLVDPASMQNLTSVGACDQNGRRIAAFSGRGYTATNRIKPDIIAPGIDIVAPSAHSTGYTNISGTCAAAAFVAGSYAVMLQAGVIKLEDTSLSGEALKLYLLKAATRSSSNVPYPNNIWGYGVLNVDATMEKIMETVNASS